MATPQTENGFVMIALDLFAAVLSADLPNREMIVLGEVLIQSYGPAKRRDVHLDAVALEHYSGLHRNNVRRAVRGLTEAGILATNDDGSYRFVKDYESWTPASGRLSERLGGGVLRFAKSAVGRFGKRPKTSATDPIQEDCESTNAPIPTDCIRGPRENPTGLHPGAEGESNGILSPIGTRASEELEIQEFKTPPTPAGEVARATSDSGPAPENPRIPFQSPAPNPEAVAVVQWAEEVMPQLGPHAGTLIRLGYKPSRVKEAITAAVIAKPGESWRSCEFIQGILRRYDREGESDAEREARGGGGRASLPGSKPREPEPLVYHVATRVRTNKPWVSARKGAAS